LFVLFTFIFVVTFILPSSDDTETYGTAGASCAGCLGGYSWPLAEIAHVGYADLCHDSANHASMLALAAPSVRQSMQASLLSLNRDFL
jgi:hypothetical protein